MPNHIIERIIEEFDEQLWSAADKLADREGEILPPETADFQYNTKGIKEWLESSLNTIYSEGEKMGKTAGETYKAEIEYETGYDRGYSAGIDEAIKVVESHIDGELKDNTTLQADEILYALESLKEKRNTKIDK